MGPGVCVCGPSGARFMTLFIRAFTIIYSQLEKSFLVARQARLAYFYIWTHKEREKLSEMMIIIPFLHAALVLYCCSFEIINKDIFVSYLTKLTCLVNCRSS